MKTLILSDLHLGADTSSAPRMLDGLRPVCAQYDRVILNGDTLDRYEKEGCEPQAAGLIADALDACRSRQGPPELLTGNHDPAISMRHWLYLEESATLVFHGDCIQDCTHPSKPSEKILVARLKERWKQLGGRPERFVERIEAYRPVQRELSLEHPPRREQEPLLAYLLGVLLPPQKPIHVFYYWYMAPRWAARLARTFDKPVRYVAIGHTHRTGSWTIDGVKIFNTGSFMPLSAPAAISAEHDRLRYLPISELLRSARTIFLPLAASAPAGDGVLSPVATNNKM